MLDLERPVRRIAIIGNHVPRKCGIASFTRDTAEALRKSGIEVDVVAMSDQEGYEYPASVAFEIPQEDLSAYPAAAAKLNAGGYDLVSLQHEFGIFGGPDGIHLLSLLRELKMPIVSTFHTVLAQPDELQRAVLEEIASFSERIIVMSDKAKSLLEEVHGISPEKIDVIPHGIPDLTEESVDEIKASYGLAGHKVILTFGLLCPDKGIEYAIEALAAVPDAIFVVAGQTHPHIARHSGEAYRDSLIARANEYGVTDRMRFIERFVDDEELSRLLKMADIYVSAYQKEAQITSGTLAYTVGNGKAVVSTPYWHAQELLDEDRGILVPFRDARALADAMNSLLSDETRRKSIEAKAYAHGRSMRWPAVAQSLRLCFQKAAGESSGFLHGLTRPQAPIIEVMDLPIPKLTHLERMTDDTGILQHARFIIPRRQDGYCVDDNSRALIAAIQLEEAGLPEDRLQKLQAIYLSFCEHAFNTCSGRFRNFMSFDRRWLERSGSDDSHGRTMWSLGVCAARAQHTSAKLLASDLFRGGVRAVDNIRSPRALVYCLLGFEEIGWKDETSKLAGQIKSLFNTVGSEEWPWFEDKVSYANGRIPQALIQAGQLLDDESLVETGLTALAWLCRVQTFEGYFSPIGNAGFYEKGGQPAIFDQQPIEAAAQVSACLAAFDVTGESQWKVEAERAFGWFMGRNVLRMPAADFESGGCRDGLSRYGVNENQGAESTICCLMALTELRAHSGITSKPSTIA